MKKKYIFKKIFTKKKKKLKENSRISNNARKQEDEFSKEFRAFPTDSMEFIEKKG